MSNLQMTQTLTTGQNDRPSMGEIVQAMRWFNGLAASDRTLLRKTKNLRAADEIGRYWKEHIRGK